MINIILYNSVAEIFRLKNIEKPFAEYQIVTSDPLWADLVREKIVANHLSKNTVLKFDAITISSFITTELQKFSTGEVLRKAELLQILSKYWREYFDGNYNDFINVYNIVSDLRSFSVKLDVLYDIISAFPERVRDPCKIMFWIMTEKNLIDEHSAYDLLGTSYSENEIKYQFNGPASFPPVSCAYIIVGFQHMSALQIRFLQEFSKHFDVYIYFPKEVYDLVKHNHWIKWISLDAKIIESTTKKSNVNELVTLQKIQFFEKDELDLVIKQIRLNDNWENVDLYLCCNELDDLTIQEFNSVDVNYKYPTELFVNEYENIYRTMLDKVIKGEIQTYSEALEVVEGFIKEVCSATIELRNFKKLKILLLLLSTLKKRTELFSERSENNSIFGSFEFQVAAEIVRLDLPRTFSFSYSSRSPNVKCIKHIPAIDHSRENVFIWRKSYLKLSSTEKYPQEILKTLEALGPLRSKKDDQMFLKYWLMCSLKKQNILWCIEKGIDNELANEIIQSTDMKNLEDRFNKNISAKKISENKSYLDTYIEKNISEINKSSINNSVSVSALQTYFDCPRKYFFTYIKNYQVDYQSNSFLDARQLGSLQHDLIQLYFEFLNSTDTDNNDDKYYYDNSIEKFLEIKLNFYLNTYLKDKNIVLSLLDYKSVQQEICNGVCNGVNFLLNIQKYCTSSEIKFRKKFWEFEVSLFNQDTRLRGRVDCKTLSNMPMSARCLFDFKRSSSSIPSLKDVQSLQKIQLVSYLSFYKKMNMPLPNLYGYLNLKDISESLIFTNDLLLMEIVEKSFSDIKINLITLDEEKHLLSSYQKLELDKLSQMMNDRVYPAIPNNGTDTCKFCHMKMLCVPSIDRKDSKSNRGEDE